MVPEFFFAIAPVVVVLYMMFLKYKELRKQHASIVAGLGDTITQSIIQVECDTFTSGKKNHNYLFRFCDLHFTEDAVIILGYNQNSLINLPSTPIILTNNIQVYLAQFPLANVLKPKKINPYSFNNEVYIEFGESGFTTTNVEIRLKRIPDNIKEELRNLFPN